MAVLDVLSKRVPQPPKDVELHAGGGRRRANGVQMGQIEVTCKKVTQIPPNARRPSKKELVGEWDFLMPLKSHSPTNSFLEGHLAFGGIWVTFLQVTSICPLCTPFARRRPPPARSSAPFGG